uniref:Uncharacterized protein n=1 Tax=Romanomermis culicivorax TaxID=13658 RepID=A0A915IMA3_ROMCU
MLAITETNVDTIKPKTDQSHGKFPCKIPSDIFFTMVSKSTPVATKLETIFSIKTHCEANPKFLAKYFVHSMQEELGLVKNL